MCRLSSIFLVVLVFCGCLSAGVVEFKKRCLDDLLPQVPKILAALDRSTGRFGEGIWIVNDQNVILALAAAWSSNARGNPHYHSDKLLDAIMAGGDALIADADEDGKWVFRKKDGSTWGKIYMPWTYSRWIRTFAIVRDAIPSQRRAKWEKALRLGYTGISRELQKARLVNIPAHHAMGLYFAGQVFQEAAWMKQATDFLHRIVGEQHADGYWSEHIGPVVLYNTVYSDALGTYLAASGDGSVLPALRKAAVFHSWFTYPDGTLVETIDERNPHTGQLYLPNVGFTYTPEGRTYFARQLARYGKPLPADESALLLLYGREGPGLNKDPLEGDFEYVLGKGDAAVRRRGAWFLAVSAMTAPLSTSRWIQDRQDFFSVYQDGVGLILGGGSTKLQPRWSTFTVGDVELLTHRPGDENPNFLPPAGLVHVPGSAHLLPGRRLGVELVYGNKRGTVELKPGAARRLEILYSGDRSMVAHLPVLPRLGKAVTTAAGKSLVLGDAPFAWATGDIGGWIEHGGVRLRLPKGATVRWPLVPHNPYRKDGRAEASEGRVVIDLPLEASGRSKVLVEIR